MLGSFVQGEFFWQPFLFLLGFSYSKGGVFFWLITETLGRSTLGSEFVVTEGTRDGNGKVGFVNLWRSVIERKLWTSFLSEF